MFGHDAAVLGRHDSYLQIQVTKFPQTIAKTSGGIAIADVSLCGVLLL
jgi:hypothetical protein